MCPYLTMWLNPLSTYCKFCSKTYSTNKIQHSSLFKALSFDSNVKCKFNCNSYLANYDQQLHFPLYKRKAAGRALICRKCGGGVWEACGSFKPSFKCFDKETVQLLVCFDFYEMRWASTAPRQEHLSGTQQLSRN